MTLRALAVTTLILGLSPNALLSQSTEPPPTSRSCPQSLDTGSVADDLLAWGCKTADWLSGALRGFRTLAKDEDRLRASRAIRRFANDILAIERSKRALLASLRREPRNYDDINRAAQNLSESVRRAQNTLNNRISPLLLQEYRVGGATIEEALSSTLLEKEVVLQAMRQPSLPEHERRKVLAAGDSALTALRAAQLSARALADSVESLVH